VFCFNLDPLMTYERLFPIQRRVSCEKYWKRGFALGFGIATQRPVLPLAAAAAASRAKTTWMGTGRSIQAAVLNQDKAG